ncbi:MAG: hypothetical protein R2838_11010 [Caldilineaceae bacterium]
MVALIALAGGGAGVACAARAGCGHMAGSARCLDAVRLSLATTAVSMV